MLHRNYIDHHLVDHCTFRCKNCTTYSEYAKPKFGSIESFEKDIKRLSEVLSVNNLRFYGGEPLLHPELVDYIRITKKSGIAKKVGVVTNGQLIPKQSEEFFSSIDDILVSAYTKSSVDYDLIFNILFEKKEKYNFDIIIHEQISFSKFHLLYKQNKDETLNSYNKCWAKDKWNESGCHTVKDGYYYKCSKPISQERFMVDAKMQIENDFIKEDGVYLYDDNLEERLIAYIKSVEPLNSCSYCVGIQPPNPEEWVPWEMLPMKKPEFYPR
jgi:organic radical activating enzyme